MKLKQREIFKVLLKNTEDFQFMEYKNPYFRSNNSNL